MEIVTSWREEGLERGRRQSPQQGRRRGTDALLFRQIQRRIGGMSDETQPQIGRLDGARLAGPGVARFDFALQADLDNWLSRAGF